MTRKTKLQRTNVKKIRNICRVISLFTIAAVFMSVQTAAALSNKQTRAFDRGVRYYNTEVCGGNGDASVQPMIVLDPGHSGKSITTQDESGLKDFDYPNPSAEKPLENEEMMYVALNVKKQLQEDGYRVGMTKGNDLDENDAKSVRSKAVREGARMDAGLRERADYANGQNADLAISLHDDHSQPFNSFGELYTQKVGLFRIGTKGEVKFEDKKVAADSQAAGKIFAEQRAKAEGRPVQNKDADFGGREGLDGGNIPQVMLYAKVPWVYNEVGAAPVGNHLSQENLDKYVKGIVESVKQYRPIQTGGGTGTQLSGKGNPEKAYNYLKSKGLSNIHAAAIVGNLMQESGPLVSPKAVNPSSGAFGIAQWLGGRKSNLIAYAQKHNRPSNDLGLQLDFLWYEVNEGSEKPMKAIPALKATKTLEVAVEVWHDKFERSGDHEKNIPQRVRYAKTVLGKEDPNNTDIDVSAEDDTTGTATCTGGGNAAINCEDSTLTTSGLSTVRQNIVCHAKAELELWKTGKMKRGTDFHKYSQGRTEAWCAHFTSWIWKESGRPVTGNAKDWDRAGVRQWYDLAKAGKNGLKLHYPGDYTPKPGDVLIWDFTSGFTDHVNLVTEVKNGKITIIGGNQNGSGGPTTSAVTTYALSSIRAVSGGQHVTAIVSPD